MVLLKLEHISNIVTLRFYFYFYFILFYFEIESHSVLQGQSAVVSWQLTATFASWVQAILLPQCPEQLGLQACTTTPS